MAKLDRYNIDIPFLCFLANLYVSTRHAELLQNAEGDLQFGNAVFRVWFTKSSYHWQPVLSVMHVKDAERELAARLATWTPEGTVAKNRPCTPPLRSENATHGGQVDPGAQIEVAVVNYGRRMPVIRQISFDPDPRVKIKCDASELESDYFTSSEDIRANPIDFTSRPIGGRDAIDLIFSKFYVPGEDPWAYHLREDDQGRRLNDKHVLDFIDDCIRETLTKDSGVTM